MIKTQICGNLVAKPEVKMVGEDHHQLCVLTVASNRPGKTTPDILRCESWGKTAENCAKYLDKGSGVFVSGDLDIDLYEKDGTTHVAVKLINTQIEFTDRKK